MKLSKSVKPISYLKQNTAEAIREINEGNGSMVITQNGEAKAMLVGIADYEQQQESLALLKLIAQSKSAYANKKHKTVKQAFTSIRKRVKDKTC